MSMTDKEKWDLTLAACQAKLPKFRIAYKDEVWHQRLLAKLLFFNKEYVEYTTTIDSVVYFTSRAEVESSWPWRTLQHEFGHAWDGRTLWGLLPRYIPYFSKFFWLIFAIVYLFPAPLPLPSPGRMWCELRMYRRSLEVHGRTDARIERYARQFTGPAYYWMWPFSTHIKKLLASGDSPYKSEMDSWLSEAEDTNV